MNRDGWEMGLRETKLANVVYANNCIVINILKC